MRVTLTGATGFIGSHVARALVAQGDTVTCLYRPTSNRVDLQDLDLGWVVGDLRDRDSLRRAIAGAEVTLYTDLGVRREQDEREPERLRQDPV